MSSKYLNLGCGKKLRSDAINVDIMPYPGVDVVLDLRSEWPWLPESVDGIYLSHILEHFPEPQPLLRKCYEVLKPDGFLRIAAPHASCITSVGCLGHYRTFSYSTFHDYLASEWYMYGWAMFNTEYQKLRWWYEEPDAEGNLPRWALPAIRCVDFMMNAVIAINPRLFENTLCNLIQCREVIWQGRKI